MFPTKTIMAIVKRRERVPTMAMNRKLNMKVMMSS
jgi:hypothetical protein